MQENPQTQNQNKTCKILRRSTHTFLTHIHHFTSTPAFLALPFSLSLLLHLHPSATSSTLHRRLHSVLIAARIPITSPISIFLLHKLSQTLSSFLSSLPLSIFLLLSKSSTIHSLKNIENHYSYSYQSEQKPSFFSLLLTHICNLFLLVAANSACFTLLCLIATATTTSATDPTPTWIFVFCSVFYSIIVANTIVISNLALISSGWEGKGGFPAILRACALIDGNTVTALALALPVNIAMFGVEVVYWCRIHGGAGERCLWAVAAEAVLIGFMYSVLIVWDTIVGCFFYRSCKEEVIEEEYECDLEKLRALEEGF